MGIVRRARGGGGGAGRVGAGGARWRQRPSHPGGARKSGRMGARRCWGPGGGAGAAHSRAMHACKPSDQVARLVCGRAAENRPGNTRGLQSGAQPPTDCAVHTGRNTSQPRVKVCRAGLGWGGGRRATHKPGGRARAMGAGSCRLGQGGQHGQLAHLQERSRHDWGGGGQLPRTQPQQAGSRGARGASQKRVRSPRMPTRCAPPAQAASPGG